MTLLSPAMHREFSVPYINRLADACGPLFYHSCSWWPRYFENIHSIRNVRAMNWNPGNSADPDVIIGEFSGCAVLQPHLAAAMVGGKDTETWDVEVRDAWGLFRRVVDARRENTSLYLPVQGMTAERATVERIYDWLDEEGWTPAARGLV